MNCCLNVIRFESSIISLAFHPNGRYLAVASGSNVEIWAWHKDRSHVPDYERANVHRTVKHMRNIRAVVFHPGGEFLLVAAPDTPKLEQHAQQQETSLYCRCVSGLICVLMTHFISWAQTLRHAIRRLAGRDDQCRAASPVQADSGLASSRSLYLLVDVCVSPTCVQAHLYSDGGLDISPDGEYLLTCVPLLASRPSPLVDTGKCARSDEHYSLSPLSHRERLRTDGTEPRMSVDDISTRPFGGSGISSRARGGGSAETQPQFPNDQPFSSPWAGASNAELMPASLSALTGLRAAVRDRIRDNWLFGGPSSSGTGGSASSSNYNDNNVGAHGDFDNREYGLFGGRDGSRAHGRGGGSRGITASDRSAFSGFPTFGAETMTASPSKLTESRYDPRAQRRPVLVESSAAPCGQPYCSLGDPDRPVYRFADPRLQDEGTLAANIGMRTSL